VTQERRGVLAIAGAALLWSTGGIGIKAIPAPPAAIACWRSAFAAIALLLFFRAAPRRDTAFLVALPCYAACLTTFVTATKWTTAANAIFLQYSGVIWVLALAPLVLRERFDARDAIAVAVAFAGMALFFVGRYGTWGRAGDVVALLSGIFFAGIILSLRRQPGAAAEAAVSWGNVLTALVLVPAAVAAPLPSPRSLMILGALGVFQLAAAYILFVYGVARVSATRASLVSMLEPVANPIWVFLALGESPSPFALAGGAVVLGAVAWRTATRDPAAPTPVDPPPLD
jgi:drug/metabolite transporter (DMT)-like permease